HGNYLPNAIKRQCIFLRAKLKTDKRGLALRYDCLCFRGRKIRGRSRACRLPVTDPIELTAQYLTWANDLDCCLALCALNDAVEYTRIHPTRSGAARNEAGGGEIYERLHAVNRKANGRTIRHHHDTSGLIMCCVRKPEQAPQADNGYNRSTQIGQAQEALRRERHIGKTRNANDLAHRFQSKAQRFFANACHKDLGAIRPASRLPGRFSYVRFGRIGRRRVGYALSHYGSGRPGLERRFPRSRQQDPQLPVLAAVSPPLPVRPRSLPPRQPP